jgi:predicted acyltransferase
MYGINVPDCGKGNLTEECNFGAYIDEKVFTIKHMLEVNDPEGIITTLDSIFNTFIGMEFMRIFQKFKSKSKELLTNWLILSIYLIIMSLLALIVKLKLYNNKWTPFNKKIWSPSFMLATSGISGLALVICFLVFDYYKNFITEKIKWPLVWMGMNPLFVYIA